jgi:cyclophilin family peptidyl-prolyl cis-trans isomerase
LKPHNTQSDQTVLDVLQQFRLIYGSMRRHFRLVEERCGMSGSQMWVLQEVQRSPELGIGELAARMGIHQSTCSLMVDKLVALGCLEKRKKQSDQRRVGLCLAERGREALAAGGSLNTVGTLAMARTNEPNSATSQFFINVKDNAFLNPTPIPPGEPVPRFEYQGQVYDNVPRARLLAAAQLYGYTVFGKVVSGMEVVNKIKAVPTGAGGPFPSDVPKTPIIIQSATQVP